MVPGFFIRDYNALQFSLLILLKKSIVVIIALIRAFYCDIGAEAAYGNEIVAVLKL